MGKLVLDKSGDLRKSMFYRFNVPFDDLPLGEDTTPDWIVIPRTPTDDVLRDRGDDPWMYIAEGGDLDTEVKIKDCPVDSTHETHRYYTTFIGIPYGGKRISPFIPTKNFCSFALSDDLRRHIESLKIRGARIDPIVLTDEDLRPDEKLKGFWAFQFVGRDVRRIPKVFDVPNACGFCGKTKIICETCGHWTFGCEHCGNHMVILDAKHGGPDDKRIPYEDGIYRILEGKTWDGSDLVSSRGINYASKRFIDWLLRIHAAPFYAEPVYFCVDGMSDQQKKWFDELQKPFEV